jgi:hypothetical protein
MNLPRRRGTGTIERQIDEVRRRHDDRDRLLAGSTQAIWNLPSARWTDKGRVLLGVQRTDRAERWPLLVQTKNQVMVAVGRSGGLSGSADLRRRTPVDFFYI